MSAWKDFIEGLRALSEAPLPPLPQALRPKAPWVEMTSEEVAGRDMLTDYRFSRRDMAEDGVLDAYLALNIDSDWELAWRYEYTQALLARRSSAPEGLLTALSLAEEYRDAGLMGRTLDAAEDAGVTRDVPDAALLPILARLADSLLDAASGWEAELVRDGLSRLASLAAAMAERMDSDELSSLRWKLEDAGYAGMQD